ncbi:9457_t:CDS:2, partial [Acaulospora morrowiae]
MSSSSSNSSETSNVHDLYLSTESIKPVIYYNGRFHLVEDEDTVNSHSDKDSASFQIYNLKGAKHDLIGAITDLSGLSST